jgi:8-oxo-dGTP diphosphatase
VSHPKIAPKSKPPRAACTVVLSPSRTLVLAVSRKDDRTKFGLPGGKVDPGETVRQCAVRETHEETGLLVHVVRKVFDGLCEGEVPHDTACYLAMAEDWSGETKESGKVEWVSWDVLFRGPFSKYNRAVYDELMRANELGDLCKWRA